MGEVRWTEEAADWLREIHDHIAPDHPEAALWTVRGHASQRIEGQGMGGVIGQIETAVEGKLGMFGIGKAGES